MSSRGRWRSPASRRILVVDDEPDIAAALASVLEAGLERAAVRSVASGAEGLRILETERIHLIVTDYRMPDMDGVTFLDEARRVSPASLHLLVTAYDHDLAEALGARLPLAWVVTKPVAPQAFLELCAHLLDHAPDDKPLPLARPPRPVRFAGGLGTAQLA